MMVDGERLQRLWPLTFPKWLMMGVACGIGRRGDRASRRRQKAARP